MIYKFKSPIYITRPLLPDLVQLGGELSKIWDSQWLTNNGEQQRKLEQRLKNYLKVQRVSLFNNGTIALMVAIKALKISGEVITTPFTFPATSHALTWNGITPVFCDIDQISMNIDPDKIERLITPKTTAILAVHVFGTPCNFKKIQKIADKYGLKVIYDAAHAFGAEIDGKGIGTFGDVTMFSFHATKLFHTAEGGALVCKDAKLKEKIDLLRNFGIKNEEEVILPGINGKMNEIQAALGLCVLDITDKERRKREKLARAYRNCLKNVDGVSCLPEASNIKESCQYFVIRINKELFGMSRDEVYEKFKVYNVFTRKYFYPLCSSYPHYSYLGSAGKDNLPVAYNVEREVLSMPFYGQLSERDIKNICSILKSFHK